MKDICKYFELDELYNSTFQLLGRIDKNASVFYREDKCKI